MLTISKVNQDNAKFIMKYLDTADSKSFKANFSSYNETMFAQLLLFSQSLTYQKGEFLYQSGDHGNIFYFVIEGSIEIIGKSVNSDDFKFLKSVEPNQYFGLKTEYREARSDYARVTSDACKVMQLDTQKFYDIVSKTQLSACEKKVEFLNRYVPKLRNLPRRLVEDYEVYFQKELYTQGYQI